MEEGTEDVRMQVEAGTAQAVRISIGGEAIGAFVVRVDHLAAGPQGVIVAGAGDGKGVDLVNTLIPVIEGLFYGVTSKRVHTRRPGIAKQLVKKHGYRIQEFVLVKD